MRVFKTRKCIEIIVQEDLFTLNNLNVRFGIHIRNNIIEILNVSAANFG